MSRIGVVSELFCGLDQMYLPKNEMSDKKKQNLMNTVTFDLNKQMHFEVIYWVMDAAQSVGLGWKSTVEL